jgi:hypothetical protein
MFSHGNFFFDQPNSKTPPLTLPTLLISLLSFPTHLHSVQLILPKRNLHPKPTYKSHPSKKRFYLHQKSVAISPFSPQPLLLPGHGYPAGFDYNAYPAYGVQYYNKTMGATTGTSPISTFQQYTASLSKKKVESPRFFRTIS